MAKKSKIPSEQLTIFLVVGHQHEDGMMDIHWFMGIKSQNCLNKLIEEKMYRIPSNVAVEIMISRYFRYSKPQDTEQLEISRNSWPGPGPLAQGGSPNPAEGGRGRIPGGRFEEEGHGSAGLEGKMRWVPL